MAAEAKVSRTCIDCGIAPLGPRNTCGACKVCLLKRQRANPEFQAKRLARLAAANAKPENRANNSRAQKAYYARNPAAIEALREHGRRVYAVALGGEKCRTESQSPRTRAIISAKAKQRAEIQIAWCPPAYRAEFRALLRKYGMNAAKAKKIMVDDRIPRFEMQMWRVQQGAGLVAKPTLSKTYDYTLAGGSPL